MQTRCLKGTAILFLVLLASIVTGQSPQKIPRTWDEAAIESLEVPLARAEYSPVHVDARFYEAIPVRPIYKSYPAYAPGRAPAGYLDWLKQQEPAIAFDAGRLHTAEDWTRAGEIVFDAPIFYDTDFRVISATDLADPPWYRETGTPVDRDGIIPFTRYVVRTKGVVEVGQLSCGMCHTRVMADGTVLKGAQGNIPLGAINAFRLRESNGDVPVQLRQLNRMLFGTPWLRPDPVERLTLDESVALAKGTPAGVIARQRTSLLVPTQVPDLIGLEDRKFLDRTGVSLQRNIGDLMRYAALNQDADTYSSYGGFVPAAINGRLPSASAFLRYSDEQLYALALYLYALEPPPNPNPFDETARRGQQVFEREGCARCHTPPLYTNNMLVPAPGFRVPDEHLHKYDVVPEIIGTDPELTMNTRRGTGYYKVPSLKGVWYRGPFEHMGSVATLEDWFDARRLRDDYVPTGFKGHRVTTRAVKGHEFGLALSAEDNKALLGFLRTL